MSDIGISYRSILSLSTVRLLLGDKFFINCDEYSFGSIEIAGSNFCIPCPRFIFLSKLFLDWLRTIEAGLKLKEALMFGLTVLIGKGSYFSHWSTWYLYFRDISFRKSLFFLMLRELFKIDSFIIGSRRIENDGSGWLAIVGSILI